MGYRCPNCFQDFGLDKSKLDEHFSKNPECATEAWVHTDLWKKSISIKSSKYKTKKESSRKRYISSISPKHHFVKQNIISNDDCSDTVVCSKCGLKAKRFGNSMKFDMRYTRLIQYCIDN